MSQPSFAPADYQTQLDAKAGRLRDLLAPFQAPEPEVFASPLQRVIAQQTPSAARRAIADALIFNDGLSLDALRAQVQVLWRHWSALPRGRAAML